jgi:hypothetical protein
MQSLGHEVAEFLSRFAASQVSITQSCKEIVEAVDLGAIVTLPTLSSYELTNDALARLAKASTNLDSAIEVIYSHRAAAVREFSGMITSLGLASPEAYVQHFEARVAQELILEAEELKAVLIVIDKAEVIARFVHELRPELQFDDTDILFPDQSDCDEYASFLLDYGEAQAQLRRVIEAREAWLLYKVTRAAT